MITVLLTIACPLALIDDASQLARVIGESAADEATFTDAPVYVDAEGNRYAVPHGAVFPAFIGNAVAPLAVPEWGADMDAATRAQACVTVWQMPEDGEDPGPLAAPDRIAAVPGMDMGAALAVLGLVREVSDAAT